MATHAVLMDVKRLAVHDGPGIRTTLFLKGCPLKCLWCHNPEGIAFKPQLAYYAHKCVGCGECVKVCPAKAHSFSDGVHQFDDWKCVGCGACESACFSSALKFYGKTVSVEEAVAITLEDRDFYGSEGGVTLSGGEAMLQIAFVFEFLKAIKKEGIHVAIDTCGHVPWSHYEQIIDKTDLFLYDIKHMDSATHKKLTGQGNELILSNIKSLSDRGAHVEVRIPLIPGCNDNKENLMATGRFLSTMNIDKVKILPYHSMARAKYKALNMEDTMPKAESPSQEDLSAAVELLRGYGLAATM